MRASLLAVLLLAGCAVAPVAPPSTSAIPAMPEPLRTILGSSPELRAAVARAAELRLQVVLGLIEDGHVGGACSPWLRQIEFRAGAEYFYPASSVKLFAAVAALERLEELRRETGLELTVDTPLVDHPLFEGEVLESTDP